MNNDDKRLFFGAQVKAAWPQELPQGRMIAEDMRHITLAFLGQHSFQTIESLLPSTPLPSFRIGPCGAGNQWIFLPKEQARVVALEIDWIQDPHPLFCFQEGLSLWLATHGYPLKKHAFHPHITVARAPFDREAWTKHVEPIPFFLSALHLYESLGHLEYRPLWTSTLISPFLELDHTADLAFEIRGESIPQLFLHAQLALFFHHPALSPFFTPSAAMKNLDQLIIELNRMIALADTERGCPFKAVSFHGDIVERSDKLLTWEMIVDV